MTPETGQFEFDDDRYPPFFVGGVALLVLVLCGAMMAAPFGQLLEQLAADEEWEQYGLALAAMCPAATFVLGFVRWALEPDYYRLSDVLTWVVAAVPLQIVAVVYVLIGP